MEKRYSPIFKTIFIGVVAFVFAGAGFLFWSCNSNVGLGSSVDTEAPKVSIEYPPSNAVVRDFFILAGECSDDKGVAKVEVTIANSAGVSLVHSATPEEDGTWKVRINDKGNDSSYPLSDGKYVFRAVAYDEIGRTSTIAERAIEIDNTEPVFIIKSPGGIDINNPTSYGSMFKVAGNIADDHDIKEFRVKVYDKETSAELLNCYEENISVAGGTEVTFAQYDRQATYNPSGESLNDRYLDMYGGPDASGDKPFYCTVRIMDAAEKYTNPKNSTGGGWNTSPDNGSEGNVTTKVYLYDDVYTKYMGKNSDYKFTASDFKAILNGSYKVADADEASQGENRAAVITSDTAQKLKEELLKVLKDTATEKQRLAFKLNKDANPHYEFSGYAIDKENDGYKFSDNSASKGSKITFTAKMGLDETLIDPRNITVYCFGPYESVTVAEMSEIYINPKAYYEKHYTDNKPILFNGSETYKGGTVESFTESFTMGDISDGKKYVLAAYGVDQDDLELVASVEYGFEGIASGQPPRITITKPTSSNNAVIQLNGDMTITGTATSAASEITEVRYEITVYNEGNGNAIIANTEKEPMKGNATLGPKTDSNGTAAYTWSFDITKDTNYSRCAAKDGDNYKYVIRVIAKNSIGLEGQADTTLAVDAKNPEINNITVTPIAKNKDEKNPDVVNGRIKVSFSISDSYLAGTKTRLVLKQGDTVKKDFKDKYADSQTLVEEYIYTTEKDGTGKDVFADNTDLTFEVTVEDKAGNRKTEEYVCRIDQSTDNPVVTITGAEDSGTVKGAGDIKTGTNLFGVSSRTLNGSVSDDDGIGEAYISVYEGEGVAGKKPLDKHNKIKIEGTLSHQLPEEEGVYTVVVEATDKRENGDTTPKRSITKTYYVAVDSGAPTIKNMSPASGGFVSLENGMTVNGTVTDGNGIASISVITGIDKDGNGKIEWDETNGTAGGTSEQFDKNGAKAEAKFVKGVKEYTIKDDKIKPIQDAQGTYAVKYIATDIYGQSSEYQITYNIDAGAPKFTIKTVNTESVNLSGGSATPRTPIYLNNSSGFLDVEGEVEDDVAFDGSVYYRLDTTPPNLDNSNDLSAWGRSAIIPDGDSTKKGKWKLSIPVNNYTSGTTYFLYITFKDSANNVSKSDKNPSGIITVIPDGDKPEIGSFVSSTTSISNTNSSDSITFTVTGLSDGENGSGIDKVLLFEDGNQAVDTAFTLSSDKSKGTLTVNNDTYKKLYEESREHIICARVFDNVGNSADTKTVTIGVDSKAPTVNITSVSPTVTKDSVEWLNGVVKVGVILIDETALSNNGCYWYVEDENGEKISGIESAGVDSNLIDVAENEKYYKNIELKIDTTKITTTNGKYTLVVHAVDKGGNSDETTRELNIDQSTDLPTLNINNVDDAVSVDKIESGKNLFSPGTTLNGSASDDDGIESIDWKLYNGKDETGTLKKQGSSILISLADDEGYYTLVVTVTDKNKNDPIPPRTITKTYHIALDSGAPTFESVTPVNGNYYSQTMSVSGTVKDGNGIKIDENGIAKIKRENKKNDGTIIDTDDNITVGSDGKFEDTVTPPATDGDYKVEYTATDIFGQSQKHTITYKVDSAAPTFTITQIGDKPVNLSGGSATAPDTVYLNKKDGMLEVSGSVNDEVSGFDGFVYYALAETAPNYTADDLNNTAVWTKTGITTSDNKVGTWKLSIPVKAEEYVSGKEYLLYITFKDGAGNISLPANNPSGKVKVIPDGVVPTIADLKADPNGLANTNATADVKITATVTDFEEGVASNAVSGVASVALYENSTKIGEFTSTGGDTYEIIIKKANYENLYNSGVHTLEVRATDNAGNETSKTVSVSVDTEAPTITINSISPRVAKGSDEYLNGTVTVSLNLTDETALGDGTAGTGNCYWYVTEKGKDEKIGGLSDHTDADGKNNLIKIESTEKLYKNLSISLDTTKISGDYSKDGTTGKGEYTLHVYAVDKAGNPATATAELNIDQETDIPTISLNKEDNDKLGIEGNTIQITVKDDDEVGKATYKLDDAETETAFFTRGTQKKTDYSYAITLPNDISTGEHKLTVTVEDYVAGRASPQTNKKTLNFIYDNDIPIVSIDSLPEFQKETVKITGSASDKAGIASVVGTLEKDNVAVGGVSIEATPTKKEGSETDYTWEVTATIPKAEIDDSATYKWTFTATDKNGRTSTAFVTHKVDVTAPDFVNSATDTADKITFKAGTRTVYSDTVNTAWFKEGQNSITISGKLTETNPDRVIMTITGKDASGTDRSESVNYATATPNYSINSTYYDGTNTVALQAYDKAENSSSSRTFTLKVDTNAPRLLEGKAFTDANGNAITDNGTVNTKTLKLSYSATDLVKDSTSTDVSGLAQILIGSKYGFAEAQALYNSKNTDGNSAFTSGTQTVAETDQEISLTSLSEGENTLYIRLIDVAGNVYEDELVKFTYDVNPATVSIASPAADAIVNKTITITGSVSDKIGLPDEPTGYLQIKEENGDWKEVDSTAVQNLKIDGSSWSCELDTTKYNDKGTDKTVSIRMIIPDKAGNENLKDEGRQIIINQDSDRPKIVLTNMDITGSKIKQSTMVYGSLTDDDSDSTGVVKGLYIIKKSVFDENKTYPTTTNDNGWKKLTVQAGSGSFSHEGDDEGLLEFYFYCIDNKDTHFYWKANNVLDQMKIAGMKDKQSNGTYDYKDETGGISYTADMEAPVVTIQVARGDVPTDYSAGGKVFSKNGNYSKLYMELTVVEAVEMKKDNGKFATPIVKLNDIVVPESKLGNITINGTSIATFSDTNKPTDGKYVYEIGPIALNTTDYNTEENINSWRLSAEVSDASDQKGVGNMNITMDQTAPQILITSPSPSISDAVMAAITVKGLAQDDASSITDLRWAIPLTASANKYDTKDDNRGLFTPIGASSAWEIKFSSGSEDSPDSLLFYAKNFGIYNVEETVSGSGIYKVPIWFYVEDAVGNKAVQTTDADGKPLVVYVDADGGKPKAWINSPEQKSIVTGLVTIYGGASDNISVDKVEIQVDVDGDGDYDEDDYDLIANGTLGGEIKTALAGTRTDNWYIPTIGTNSWKVTIDTSAIASNTKIGIHCRAWDNEDKPNTRGWTAGEEVRVTIDTNAPAIRDVKLVQFGDGVNPKNTPTASPVSELEYTSGMYISHVSVADNGTWYLTATVTDNIEVKSITAERMNITTSTHIVDLVSDVLNGYSVGTDEEQKIFIPIETKQSGMVYSTLKATDDTNGLALKQILINIDSTAPSLFGTDNMLTSNANANLRLKPSNSNNPIGDRNVPNREQVSNSNGLFTFGDYVQEAESGLAFLAFYFERSNTIYDPMNKGVTATTTVQKNAEKLPALSLTVERKGEDSLTISGVSPTDKTFIRKGGLVKIGGSYRLITKVDGDTVNFTPTCSTSFTKAEIIFAQIVDHQISEGVKDGKVDPAYDDGDEMIESVNHIGSSYIWSASIDSSNIADGPITIGVAAIDNAGNIATGSIQTFVSNNRPRIAKVMLATDLNGDGKFTYAASANNYVPSHDVSKLKEEDRNSRLTYIKDNLVDGSSFGEFNYYKVMTPTGIAQEEAELKSEAFKVVEGLCVLPEFVGGNGDIKYIMTQSASKDDNYNSKKNGAESDLKSMKAKTALTEVATHANNPTGDQYDSIISEKGGIVIGTLDEKLVNDDDKTYLSFTFWDKTAGTVQGTDSQWAHLQVPITYLTNETNVPTPAITPFYWNSKTDNSVHKDNGNLKGHIELGVLPQVSGKIVIEGVAKDDVRLSSVTVNVNGIVNGATLKYEKGQWTYTGSIAGVESFVGEDEDISQNGHTMKWTLVCDTENLSSKAGSSYVNVSAVDWLKNGLTTSGTQVTKTPHGATSSTDTIVSTATGDGKQTAYYKIDVVPYITGVWTKLSEFYRSAPSVYARTALGHYPVSAGETVTIYGYNLGGTDMKATIESTTEGTTENTSLNIGGETAEGRSAMTGTGYNVTIPKEAKSGELVLTVGGIKAINNNNGNDDSGAYDGTDVSNMYNRQPNNVNNNTLTDDVFFDVWEFKTAAEPKNGPILQPHMKVGPNGELGFSYDNATLYFNMPGVASDGNKYGQTVFGRNFGGFTSNAFTYDKSGRAFGVALCPDTSGQAGMSANLQFFSAKSGLHEGEGGGDLNNNYYNQSNARRIENTSIKLDGSTIQQNINRILSPSMTTYTADNKTYVYTAYYDELSKQVRFRVGSVASTNDNDIGMGLVDLDGATGRVAGKDDEPKINPSTTRDSISGYITEIDSGFKTENVSNITDMIIFKVPVSLYTTANIHYYNTDSGIQSNSPVSMDRTSDGSYFTYVLRNTTACSVIFTSQTGGWNDKTGDSDNLRVTEAGVYELTQKGVSTGAIKKLTSGTITYKMPSSMMPSYAGHGYCHVVAANGVSGGTAEYSSTTDKQAGQYVAVGALKDGTAVIAWYDSSAGRLAFSYNSSPRAAQSSLSAGTTTWQNNAYYVSNEDIRAGTHVSMAVDASDGVHLAYYSASGGDLWYSYIASPTTQTSASAAVMVDSFGSVGTYTMIDVAKDSSTDNFVPYISFRCESNAETSASVKIAYPVDWNGTLVNAGVGNADDYTGHWEVSVVPTGNTPITDYTSVGVNKDWSTGVRKAFDNIESDKSKSWSATFPVGNSTTVHGNGTMHPIVSYAVSENYILEMAQKK